MIIKRCDMCKKDVEHLRDWSNWSTDYEGEFCDSCYTKVNEAVGEIKTKYQGIEEAAVGEWFGKQGLSLKEYDRS